MALKLSNNATALLAGSIDNVATEIAVATGFGARFPTISEEGEWFPLVVIAANGNLEVMRATARTGDVITVERGQEGTSATAFDAGARVDLRLTAAAIADIVSDLEAVVAAAVTDLEGKLSAAEDASLLFPQATAELGWVQDTDVNDRVLRVVDDEGGGTGGSWTISGLDVGNTTLSTSQIPAHSHSNGTLTAENHNHGSGSLSGGSHSHGSGSLSAASHSHDLPFSTSQASAGGTNFSFRRVGTGLNSSSSGSLNVSGSTSSSGVSISGSTSNSGSLNVTGSTSSAGGGGAHDHPISHNGNWRPAYLDCIRAVKQAA